MTSTVVTNYADTFPFPASPFPIAYNVTSKEIDADTYRGMPRFADLDGKPFPLPEIVSLVADLDAMFELMWTHFPNGRKTAELMTKAVRRNDVKAVRTIHGKVTHRMGELFAVDFRDTTAE